METAPRVYSFRMDLRLFAILALVHAALFPAMVRAPVDRGLAEPESTCCETACACQSACPCATGDVPEQPQRDTTPTTPPRRGDDALRHLSLIGVRVIDSLPPAAHVPAPVMPEYPRWLPPAVFQGSTAQASLCVRTT